MSKFPEIENINDILFHVFDKEEFRVMEKEGYTVIDYMVTTPTSFDSPQAKECRGIKFYPDGRIMARPLHKFFNRGERPEEEPSDLTGVLIHEKLDGSMIHPGFDHRGELVFMTRAGRTDVARMVEGHFLKEYRERCSDMLESGVTPIFEYVGPRNMTVGYGPVISHDTPRLVLLAIRDNFTGEYLPLMGGPLYEYPNKYNPADLETVKEWVNHEGVVISWPDGYKLKVKSDDYVLKHRTKDSIQHEKNILGVILDDSVDDLAGILEDEDYKKIREYEKAVRHSIRYYADLIRDQVIECEGYERRDIANSLKEAYSDTPFMQSIFWSVYDGKKTAREAIEEKIKKNLGSQGKVNTIRPLIGAEWNYE